MNNDQTGTTRPPIRIVIIEDDATIREGYAYLLNAVEGYEVVKTYSSYDESAKHLLADKPDVLLLDIEMPGTRGIDAIQKILKVIPKLHILMLTVYENEELIFTALMRGASGYLTKNTSSQKIIDAIKEVVEGGGPMSMNIAKMVISSFKRNQDTPLTKRETQILELVSEGKSRSKIAAELIIDMETVKSHIKNIYAKLHVHSKDEAIKTAKTNKFI